MKTKHEPVFRLQIVHADGSGVRFDGGSAFERDLVAALCHEILEERDLVGTCRNEIVKRGVGFLRTEKHVSKDIEDGIKAVVTYGIEEGIRAVLLSLKRETLKIA